MSIGVGIIGANPDRGWASMAHIPALQASPDFHLAAVCTSRMESAKAAAEKFGAPQAFADPAAMAAHPSVDLVVIAVKLPQHFELVSAAIQANKAVYCEWPLGLTSAQSAELAAMAKQRGVKTVIGLQSRSSPEINYLRDLIRDGYVGKVLSTTLLGVGMVWGDWVDQGNAYTADAANGVTMLTIPLGHTLDALCWCLGGFESLDARLGHRRDQTRIIETGETIPMTAPDQIVIAGTLASGALASIQYRGGMPRGTKLLWEINGSEGDLQITSEGGHVGMFDLKLSGGRGADTALQQLAVPESYRWAPAGTPAGFPYNVAQHYALLAQDLRDGGSRCPGFEEAVQHHLLLRSIERPRL